MYGKYSNCSHDFECVVPIVKEYLSEGKKMKNIARLLKKDTRIQYDRSIVYRNVHKLDNTTKGIQSGSL